MFKVMIVDDVEFMRREIRRLRIWGEHSGFFISEEAVNGQDALKRLEVNPVDLIITDIRMPIINGLELLQKVKERKLCTCVVLLSEYCEFSYAKQGIIYGAFDYIGKPVNEDELEVLLQRVKQYIIESKQNDERVKKLEEKIVEKVETIFPQNHVKQVVELIKSGDIRAVDAAAEMVESTYIAFDKDIIKTSIIIDKSVGQITSALIEYYPWINRFIDINAMQNVNLSKSVEIVSLKTAVINIVNKIITKLNLFLLNNEGNELVRQVCLHVLENIESNLSLTAIAEKLYINKTHLSETFKQKSGITLVEYITMVKLERAKKLILAQGLRIYEIGQKLGYDDNSYFCNLFKKYTGLTPTEFKKIDSYWY